MENHRTSSVSNQFQNVVLILRCLLTVCGLVFMQKMYQKGIRYMNYFLPTYVIACTGLVYNLVMLWEQLGFNNMTFCEFEKLEELLVIIVIESYIVLSLSDAQTSKYYSQLRIVVCLLIAGTQCTMVYRLITAGASCEKPDNGQRTIIDIHLTYIFIILPQLVTAASIMCIYPHTDKETDTMQEETSSQKIHLVGTEIKIDSSPENNKLNQSSNVTTLRDSLSCTATSRNNPDVTMSSNYPSCDDVTMSRYCPSCDGVVSTLYCPSCDDVTSSRYCPLCDGVTSSRNYPWYNGMTPSRKYPACETSRFCLSCAVLKWSQFLVFVYLSLVTFVIKPLCIVLQEFRYIDRQNFVNGFILLPPSVFSIGIYLLILIHAVFLSRTGRVNTGL